MSENAYKQAGVDVEAGYESVRLIKDDVKKTAIEGVLGGIGGFGRKTMKILYLFRVLTV